MRKVKLNEVRIDGGTQCRVEIDQALIYQYVERMKEGDEFPMIEAVFDGATYWLTDGFHRYHAFKLLGLKTIELKYKPGTQQDAVIEALKANAKHGKNLTVADKENKVRMALSIDDKKSDAEIAKMCEVSRSMVGAVRNPEVKKRQEENRQRSAAKKAQERSPTTDSCSPTTNEVSPSTPVDTGFEPSIEELEANELAMQADMDTLHKLLESDEPLKVAHEEITRLNHQNGQLEARIHGLMNERNEAVKMVKKLQKELDKLKAKK
jgi:ParB-like chromosome segregation protein Spo0J